VLGQKPKPYHIPKIVQEEAVKSTTTMFATLVFLQIQPKRMKAIRAE
jgi:hypothetical protein